MEKQEEKKQKERGRQTNARQHLAKRLNRNRTRLRDDKLHDDTSNCYHGDSQSQYSSHAELEIVIAVWWAS